MFIKNFQVGHLQANCYIVVNEDTLQCVVIDPGDESNIILDYIEENKLKTEAIFLTHGHYDHTMAAETVSQETGAPIYINEKDLDKSGYDPTFAYEGKDTKNYKDGDIIFAAGLEFDIIETPGHSPGSVCIICQDVMFSGDTLFRGACGRVDLPGGNMDELAQSLRKLYNLEGDYEVMPGHEGTTTLENERKFNDFMHYALGEI